MRAFYYSNRICKRCNHWAVASYVFFRSNFYFKLLAMNNQEANMNKLIEVANEAQVKDAVFNSSIVLIEEITGLKAPDIEVAPPEIFKEFHKHVETINEIYKAQLTATIEAVNRQNSEPVFIVEPDYHDQAMGCGLEDRNITDRYEAMAYGWNEGIKRMFEQLPDEPLYLAPQQPQSVKDALEKAAKIVNDFAEQCYNSNATMSDLEVVASEIRALVDQPAEPPASQELEAIVNINKTVDKFLSWKLPSDFYPDCGISFEQYSNPDNDRYKALREPIGTNLFTATQAKEMFEQCLVYENDFNLDYTCKRIRRLLNAMGMSDPSNGKDTVLMGCLFSLLGTICNKLEQSKPAKG